MALQFLPPLAKFTSLGLLGTNMETTSNLGAISEGLAIGIFRGRSRRQNAQLLLRESKQISARP
jgi:hypothetical protein